MLKYQPTRFWGMFKNTNKVENGMSAEEFGKFNQNLYYNDQVKDDSFIALTDVDNAKITVSEVQHVL
jgi:hypothetical protein